MNAKGTPATAQRNARRLRAAMERRGFVAFPTEWWHFDWKGWKELPVVTTSAH
ncbi:MAG: M15 family metallopeptidase [Synechococcus sp.]|nr:M15 family metallopeptidase [Synechococcus sp.]